MNCPSTGCSGCVCPLVPYWYSTLAPASCLLYARAAHVITWAPVLAAAARVRRAAPGDRLHLTNTVTQPCQVVNIGSYTAADEYGAMST